MNTLYTWLEAYNKLRPQLDALGFDKAEHRWSEDGACANFWIDNVSSPMLEPVRENFFWRWEPRFTAFLTQDRRFHLDGQRMQQCGNPFWAFTLTFSPQQGKGWNYPVVEYRDLTSLDRVPELIAAMKAAVSHLP